MLDFPRWKVVLITLVALFGVVSAAPNFLSDEQLNSLPDFLPKKQLTLGLDLQGGVHLLMEVDLTEVRQASLSEVLFAAIISLST